jgi:hypothetical protein
MRYASSDLFVGDVGIVKRNQYHHNVEACADGGGQADRQQRGATYGSAHKGRKTAETRKKFHRELQLLLFQNMEYAPRWNLNNAS